MSNGRGLGGRVSADRKRGGNFEETREGRRKRLERSIRVRKCILISKQHIIWRSCLGDAVMGGEGGESGKKEKNQIGLQTIKCSCIVFEWCVSVCVLCSRNCLFLLEEPYSSKKQISLLIKRSLFHRESLLSFWCWRQCCRSSW